MLERQIAGMVSNIQLAWSTAIKPQFTVRVVTSHGLLHTSVCTPHCSWRTLNFEVRYPAGKGGGVVVVVG